MSLTEKPSFHRENVQKIVKRNVKNVVNGQGCKMIYYHINMGEHGGFLNIFPGESHYDDISTNNMGNFYICIQGSNVFLEKR